jgi:7,8-dihydro-6-hydroxymethylpterin-pyrophosphokinase
VLVPLVEIAPEFVHPLSQRKVIDLLAEVDGLGGVRGVGRLNL